jgi:type I site-specific restriction-modification system R (restriction) subunit
MLKLHYEILDFYEFIKLTNNEIKLRNKTYNSINTIIEDNFPNYKCILYGSFTTELSLPNSDIDILIVVDKLLTGFDAPRASTLYLDKQIKEHNLLQAIARVNRLCDGKDYGYVINEDLSNVDEVWKNDPYDSNYRKGALSNLSEDYHYDEYFPMHPLTLCRNLITFIVRNN